MIDFNERVGAAIQQAAGELPDGYDLLIEVERGSGTVVLWIPPVSDEEGGRRVTTFDGDDMADRIISAVKMAVEHEAHNALGEGRERGILREASSGEAATSTDGLGVRR